MFCKLAVYMSDDVIVNDSFLVFYRPKTNKTYFGHFKI